MAEGGRSPLGFEKERDIVIVCLNLNGDKLKDGSNRVSNAEHV
jgi:hypothetical protein